MFFFSKYDQNHTEAIPIIILINAIGDGSAEPVGITWGKNKYKTAALFTKKLYVRSIEGSACVFFVSLFVIFGFYHSFTFTQFIIAVFLIPIAVTLAEAKSPHTWDSPFIFLTVGLCLFFIFLI